MDETDAWLVEKLADHLLDNTLTNELSVFDLSFFVVGAEDHIVSREFCWIAVLRAVWCAMPLMDEDRPYFGIRRITIEGRVG